MIWDRERYIAHSLFEDTGREMFCELFGPLHALEKEWKRQGASPEEIAMTAFDWDYVPVVWLAGSLTSAEEPICRISPAMGVTCSSTMSAGTVQSFFSRTV